MTGSCVVGNDEGLGKMAIQIGVCHAFDTSSIKHHSPMSHRRNM